MAALLQRVMAGREEQKKQRQMDLERLLQRSVGLGRERIRIIEFGAFHVGWGSYCHLSRRDGS